MPEEPTPPPTVAPTGTESGDDRPSRLRLVTSSWNTNWDKHIIDYDELLSGGPPRDGIPSIDDPRFVSPESASEWLANNEPVIALDGGPSGLAAIEQLCRQSVGKICDNGCILLEIGQGQAAGIKNIIFQIYPKANVKVYPDYAGIQRVIGLYLT